jgi:hypothetical protein
MGTYLQIFNILENKDRVCVFLNARLKFILTLLIKNATTNHVIKKIKLKILFDKMCAKHIKDNLLILTLLDMHLQLEKEHKIHELQKIVEVPLLNL